MVGFIPQCSNHIERRIQPNVLIAFDSCLICYATHFVQAEIIEAEIVFSYSIFGGFSRYHVPREWLKLQDNLLVLFEETGGDPRSVAQAVRVVDTICSDIGEDYPPPLSEWSSGLANISSPELSLECGNRQTIASVKFASFGTPTGRCGNFQRGLCHAPQSLETLEKVRKN
jgi:hypothetical protein